MTKPEKVAICGVMREGGYLYYIDKNGDISRSRMIRGGEKKRKEDKPEVVAYAGIQRDNNYIYFMDDDGDVARLPRSRNGRLREKPATKKKITKKAEPKATRSKAKKAKLNDDMVSCEKCSVEVSHEAAFPDHNDPIYFCARCAVQITTNSLRERIHSLETIRIACASEFPNGADGEPDVAAIHQNIINLKQENSSLRRELKSKSK